MTPPTTNPEPKQPPPSNTTTPTEPPLPAHLDPKTYPRTQTIPPLNIHLELTYNPLNPTTALQSTSSPAAGANILFLGTTRNTFSSRPVAQLSYTAYPRLALKSLEGIARDAVTKHGLLGVFIAHRLGVVPVQEASIVVAVSAGHRGAAWRGGEEVLEACKARVEVWKREEFLDGGWEWRENRGVDKEGVAIPSTTS